MAQIYVAGPNEDVATLGMEAGRNREGYRIRDDGTIDDLAGAKSYVTTADGRLKALDADGDGVITRDELLAYVFQSQLKAREEKQLKRYLVAMLVLLVIFAFAVMGLTYVVVDMSKDMTTKNGDTMVDRDSGKTLQCANSDFFVRNGALVARHNDTNEHTDMTPRSVDEFDEDDDDSGVNDVSKRALGVRNIYQKRQLVSTLPEKYFKELEWLEIQSSTGSTLSLRIMVVGRILHSKLVTISGTIILDDYDIYYDDQVFTLFQEAGFVSYDEATSSSSRRRLRSVDSKIRNLRSLASNDFSLVGFFNLIDDYEWTCESVEKPELPAVFSARMSRFLVCDYDDIKNCNFKSKGEEIYEQYGVVQEEDILYMRSLQEVYENEYVTEIVNYYPYHPGVAYISQYYPGGLYRSYQKNENGAISHCVETTNMPKLRMNIPEDFLFYPLGNIEEDNLRRFRISYVVDTEEFPLAPENYWMHIDYFDDMDTHLPKVLIDGDGSIIQMDEMKTYDDADHRNFTLGVSLEDFHTCVQVTEIWDGKQFESFRRNMTLADFSDNMTEYAHLQHAWNWSLPYPPQVRGAASFTQDDLLYYLEYSAKVDAEWTAWAVDIFTDIYHVTTNSSSRRLEFARRSQFLAAPDMIVRPKKQSRQLQVYTGIDEGGSHGRSLVAISLGDFLTIDLAVPMVSLSIDVGKFALSGSYSNIDGEFLISFTVSIEGCIYTVLCASGAIGADFAEGASVATNSAISIFLNALGPFSSFEKIMSVIGDLFIIPILDIYHSYTPHVSGSLGDGLIQIDVYHSNKLGATTSINFATLPIFVGPLVIIQPFMALFRGTLTNEFIFNKRVRISINGNVFEMNQLGSYTMTVAIEMFRIWRLFWADWNVIYTKDVVSKTWNRDRQCYDLESYKSYPVNTILEPGQKLTSEYSYLQMQADGNLVLYTVAKDRVIWASGTHGNPGAYMHFQSDGNLVVYNSDGSRGLWASNTVCAHSPCAMAYLLFFRSGFINVMGYPRQFYTNGPQTCTQLYN